MESLIQVIYASAATRPLPPDELGELLARARVRNAQNGLTGMLLYADGSFFQVLEGDPPAVEAVLGRIADDPRHERIVVIVREAIARRSFAEWSMGFAAITPAEVRSLSGANDFFHGASCFDAMSPGRARKLLEAFARGRWRQSPPAADVA